MPIQFNLEKLRVDNQCENYFETGLWDCDDDISLKLALKCGFEKLYSVEIREDLCKKAEELLSSEKNCERLVIINDDSNFIEKYLVGNQIFDNKTLFFLDAHVDNVSIKNYTNKCPLFNEINAIRKLKRNDHVICIDDVRILLNRRPWGEDSYGDINWIECIKNELLNINKNYTFKYFNGIIENDVLVAYVQLID